MAIPTETRSLRIGGRDLLAEAALNNCSSLWTATVTDHGKLLATAAGTSPEDALDNVVAVAERKLGLTIGQ
jgi:hypothetical protein